MFGLKRFFAMTAAAACCMMMMPMVVAVAMAEPERNDDFLFDKYVRDFQKQYATQEEFEARREIFLSNRKEILKHNLQPNNIHLLEINEFTDRRIPEELPLGLHKKTAPSVVNNDESPMMMKLFAQQVRRADVFLCCILQLASHVPSHL